VTGVVHFGEEVRSALVEGRAVVALETSVLAQGLPAPRSAEAAERMSSAIRARGATPAWIGVVAGAVVVGLDAGRVERFCDPEGVAKIARRDLPVAVASGGLGATTVSATIWAARAAGIDVAATGGIGGVHRGTGDVSADLLELARTPLLLVCSGPKSIADPVATSERLEEVGVTVVGYRCERLPFFLVRESPVELEHRVGSPSEVAGLVAAMRALDTRSATLLCNPIPEPLAMDPSLVAEAVRRCEARAEREGVEGKALTPFLLSALAEETGGTSLEANLALLASNAALAANVAAALVAMSLPVQDRGA
jgi:pseudouridine-5'-phosphate glycosidase